MAVRASRRTVLMAIAGLALTSSQAFAQTPSTPKLLGQISASRASLRTLSGRFAQERSLGLLAQTVTSQGLMLWQRPDRLRWELLAPDAITYWVTPSGLAYASASSKGQVEREGAGSMGAALQDLLVVLGGNLNTLASRYELSASLQPGGEVLVVALPKTEAVRKHIRRIEVRLGKDLITPKEVLLEESETDRVRYRFRDVVLNGPIDPKKMQPGGKS